MPWDNLTRMPLKAELYGDEPYFRESLHDAVEVGGDLEDLSRRGAFLMVKPDGLAAGRVAAAYAFLLNHGFEVVAVEQPWLGGFVWRELWRYQLTCATLDRLAVNEHLLKGCGLLLVLRSLTDHVVPATVRLSALKGPADVTVQPEGCLRKVLGQPNRVFSFVHLADEPADLLRELGILLPAPARRRSFAAIVRGEIDSADQALLDAELARERSGTGLYDLDPQRALHRVEALVRQAAATADPIVREAVDQVGVALAAMRRGDRVPWLSFLAALRRAAVVLEHWDLAVLGTTFIVYDDPARAKRLVSVDRSLWGSPTSPPAMPASATSARAR